MHANDNNNAQRLVTEGYRNSVRRNYFLQIVNDDSQKATLPKTDPEIADFYGNRMSDWREFGRLPRETLRRLLVSWKNSGALSSRDNGKKSDGAQSTFSVDIGITFEGFCKLEVTTQLTDLFRLKALAFTEGAFFRASAYLGDSGRSDPTRWLSPYRALEAHVIVVVHAKNDNSSAEIFKRFEEIVESELLFDHGKLQADAQNQPEAALRSLLAARSWIEQSLPMANPRELHFGVIDGLSAPRFLGIDSNDKIAREKSVNVHEAGELLLGHVSNDKSNPWRVPGALEEEGYHADLRSSPDRIAYGNFFKDGSFGVFRKIGQDVASFERVLATAAEDNQGENSGLEGIAYTKAWLKAKMVGRWPNGEVVSSQILNLHFPKQAARARELATPIAEGARVDNTFCSKKKIHTVMAALSLPIFEE